MPFPRAEPACYWEEGKNSACFASLRGKGKDVARKDAEAAEREVSYGWPRINTNSFFLAGVRREREVVHEKLAVSSPRFWEHAFVGFEGSHRSAWSQI